MHKTEEGLRIKGLFNKKSKPNNPLVSIVTIVRNGEKYLERTIQSVINQTYNNIQYIIIDGISTDGTIDIIKKYANKIDYWASESDKGISDALNKGIKLSDGELIGILHSDDWYECDTIKRVIKAFLAQQDVGVIYGDSRYYQNDKPLFVIFPHPNPERIYVEMTYCHAACFVTKKCYEKFGVFNNDFKAAMDYELLLRFYINKVKFYYIHETLANTSFGGYSDRREIEALLESRKARLQYGLLKYEVKFWIFFAKKLFQKSIRAILGREHFLLQKYRKYLKARKVIE